MRFQILANGISGFQARQLACLENYRFPYELLGVAVAAAAFVFHLAAKNARK